jgi:hypothetical protein
MIRFLDLPGQGAKLRLDRVDSRREVGQGVAGDIAARRGAALGADLGLDELGVAAREDAPLDRAQLLLEPVDPPVERLRALRHGRHRDAGHEDQAEKMKPHVNPRIP